MNAKDPVPYETVVGKLGRRKDRWELTLEWVLTKYDGSLWTGISWLWKGLVLGP
jgi:hypothetical protein